jgi:hypothetical protein
VLATYGPPSAGWLSGRVDPTAGSRGAGLDRIDEIVPPGTNINQDDIYYTPPAVADKRLRRR